MSAHRYRGALRGLWLVWSLVLAAWLVALVVTAAPFWTVVLTAVALGVSVYAVAYVWNLGGWWA